MLRIRRLQLCFVLRKILHKWTGLVVQHMALMPKV